MKVVQIFPGKVWGGAEQYILDIGRALTERGHEVAYFAQNSKAVTSRLDAEGVPYKTIAAGHFPPRESIEKLAQDLSDADVVHIHYPRFVPLVYKACKLARVRPRIVMTRHDGHRTPVNIFQRRMFKQVDAVICVSDFVRQAWHGANKWYDGSKCIVLLNSIPQSKIEVTESLRQKFNIPDDSLLMVYSGRVKESKGCEVIVKALAPLAHKNWHMVYIGATKPDDYDATLMSIARQAGIDSKIHFYGFTTQARALMAQADIGLAPSVAKEAFPLTNIEFLQSGVCLISSTSGGQAECIVDGTTACLVRPGNVDDLTATIAGLLDDPVRRKSIAQAGRQYFNQHLTFDTFLDKLLKIYRGR